MKKEILPLACLLFLFFGTMITLNAQVDPEYDPPRPEPFGLDTDLNPDQIAWVRLVDIDGDDTLEAFIFKGNPGPEIEYYENDGSNADPEFVPASYSSFNIKENGVIFPWDFVDIDGDGDYDLSYFVLVNDTPLRILINKGTATDPEFEDDYSENPYGITLPTSVLDPTNLLDGVTPAFADLDRDCDLDLMYNGAINNQPDDAYFFSENTGTFSEPSYALPVRNDYGIVFPPGGNYHQSTFVDLDCDGDLDLYTIVVTASATNLWYYQNIPDMYGTAQYTTSAQPWHPLDSVDFRFVPMNGTFWDHGGDGDLDLLGGSSEGIFFWENTSPNSCSASPPMARFSYTNAGFDVSFTDESVDNPTDWYWDFGDGKTSTEQNPNHTYDEEGVYKVSLEVSNEFGCRGIWKEVIIGINSSREKSSEVSVSLAPNPVQDRLQLTLRSNVVRRNTNLQIFDSMGRLVATRDLGMVANELSETIDVSQLPPGVYFLKIGVGEQSLVRKFVRQ